MSYAKCQSEIIQIDPNTISCASGFESAIPDFDLLVAELQNMNTFDIEVFGMIVVFNFVMLIIGFSCGKVINLLRKS